MLVHGSRGALTLLKATPKATELGRIEAAVNYLEFPRVF